MGLKQPPRQELTNAEDHSMRIHSLETATVNTRKHSQKWWTSKQMQHNHV